MTSDGKPIPKFAGDTAITDGNEVISRIAYKTNGGIVIYTITPSSPFGRKGEMSTVFDARRAGSPP